MDLTSNFFVLCNSMKVYLYNYSLWVEISMNIHEERVKMIKAEKRFTGKFQGANQIKDIGYKSCWRC